MFKSLLRENNITAVTLQALASERFAAANLFGKLANIAGDIDSKHLEETARLKAISGGDVITAELSSEFVQVHSFRRADVLANKFPGSADVTVGYFSPLGGGAVSPCFTGREDRSRDARWSTPQEIVRIAAKALTSLQGLDVARKLHRNGKRCRYADPCLSVLSWRLIHKRGGE